MGSIAVPRNLLPSRRLRNTCLGLCLVLLSVLLLVLTGVLSVNPLDALPDSSNLLRLAREIFPPSLKVLWKENLASSLLETVSMAFLGSLGGGLIALVLAFFASRNVSPHPVIRLAVRSLLALERSTPNFVVLLVLLVALGIGPFAGMLSLLVGSIGMFGKLFADAIEQVDRDILESIQSVGSTRLQQIRYAILPQVAPSFIANWFYAFDVNLRAAIALGVFGGGGIGFQLHVASRVLRYHDVLAYSLLIVVLIKGMEKISDFVRRQILGPSAAHRLRKGYG